MELVHGVVIGTLLLQLTLAATTALLGTHNLPCPAELASIGPIAVLSWSVCMPLLWPALAWICARAIASWRMYTTVIARWCDAAFLVVGAVLTGARPLRVWQAYVAACAMCAWSIARDADSSGLPRYVSRSLRVLVPIVAASVGDTRTVHDTGDTLVLSVRVLSILVLVVCALTEAPPPATQPTKPRWHHVLQFFAVSAVSCLSIAHSIP
jgi:hypothetical protein